MIIAYTCTTKKSVYFAYMYPKAPCTLIVYTSSLKYLYRDPFKAEVSTKMVHGALGGLPMLPLRCEERSASVAEAETTETQGVR